MTRLLLFPGAGRVSGFALLVIVALTATGCGNGRAMIDSSSNLKHLSRAAIKYRSVNDDWPEKLEDLKPIIGQSDELGVIGDGKDYVALVKNPLTGDNPGYEYVKPGTEPDHNNGTIILYQLRNGTRDATLAVAFADACVYRLEDL